MKDGAIAAFCDFNAREFVTVRSFAFLVPILQVTQQQFVFVQRMEGHDVRVFQFVR